MNDEKINIIFETSTGENIRGEVRVGETALNAARELNAPLPGVCEGSLACSTCHVIVKSDEMFQLTKQNLPNHELSEDEEDLLDMAPEVEANSRLACQIILNKQMDGMILKIPSSTCNED